MMHLISSSMISEFAQSIGLEIVIFAITVVVAMVFRRSKRRGSCVQQHKMVDPFPEIVKPAQRKAPSTPPSSKSERQQLRAQTEIATDDVSRRVNAMLEFASRRRSSDAMDAYEELRASC